MGAAIWFVAIVFLIIAVRKTRRGRGRFNVGPAAAGGIYDMLNEDKRRAVEIVVEGRAEAQDPEDKDGNLPDLARPDRRRIPHP